VHLPAFSISTTQDFGADFRHALSDKLQTELGSDAEMLATLRNLRVRGVGIVLWLCASECKRAPEKILQSVRDYWSAFPDLPPDLLVTCILCVKYDEKPGFGDWLGKLVGRDAGKGPLRSAVESLAGAVNDQPQAHVCVLPELKSATRKDIDEWIADAKDALSRHVSEAELRKMFGDLSALPMDDAIKHLEDLLQSRPRV
jgi:hypothetical protein